jgi:hypothetical protein
MQPHVSRTARKTDPSNSGAPDLMACQPSRKLPCPLTSLTASRCRLHALAQPVRPPTEQPLHQEHSSGDSPRFVACLARAARIECFHSIFEAVLTIFARGRRLLQSRSIGKGSSCCVAGRKREFAADRWG